MIREQLKANSLSYFKHILMGKYFSQLISPLKPKLRGLHYFVSQTASSSEGKVSHR